VIRPALAAAVLLLALVTIGYLPGSAGAQERPTLADLEDEIVCPVCTPETLQQSNSPVAARIRAFIRERIEAGDSKSEIKEKLVAEFGEGVLAAPPKSGFNLLAWILPLAGLAIAGVVLTLLATRWRRGRNEEETVPVAGPTDNGRAPLDPELERRLDEELARFEN
jgi:cytochrome c-type biogenesis protein CcmH